MLYHILFLYGFLFGNKFFLYVDIITDIKGKIAKIRIYKNDRLWYIAIIESLIKYNKFDKIIKKC